VLKLDRKLKGYFQETEKPHPVSEELTIFSAKDILNFGNNKLLFDKFELLSFSNDTNN
jgi:hypothetical protein